MKGIALMLVVILVLAGGVAVMVNQGMLDLDTGEKVGLRIDNSDVNAELVVTVTDQLSGDHMLVGNPIVKEYRIAPRGVLDLELHSATEMVTVTGHLATDAVSSSAGNRGVGHLNPGDFVYMYTTVGGQLLAEVHVGGV